MSMTTNEPVPVLKLLFNWPALSKRCLLIVMVVGIELKAVASLHGEVEGVEDDGNDDDDDGDDEDEGDDVDGENE